MYFLENSHVMTAWYKNVFFSKIYPIGQAWNICPMNFKKTNTVFFSQNYSIGRAWKICPIKWEKTENRRQGCHCAGISIASCTSATTDYIKHINCCRPTLLQYVGVGCIDLYNCIHVCSNALSNFLKGISNTKQMLYRC